MSYNFYNILHVIGVIFLVGFTFYAFAGPSSKTKKWVMSAGGIMSLIVFVSGFAMLFPTWGFKGWAVIKLVVWLAISAFAGLAYRREKLRGVLMLVTIALVSVAVWAVMTKPF